MIENLERARALLRGMWRHRWLGLITGIVIGAIAGLIIALLPNRYEASARIFVDTQSILKPLMTGLAVQPNIDQQVQILSRTLISRPNVEKLVRMADLDLKLKTKQERDYLVDKLTKELAIVAAGTGADNLYTLTYRHEDPETARKVIQALVSIFVESGLGDKRKDQTTARQFIDEQIRVYEKKLADAENKLKEFKLKNLAMTGGEDFSSRISQASGALQQAKLELREAENYRDTLRRQISGEDPILVPDAAAANADAASGIQIPELDARIDALKKSLDSLMQRYTEEHPDVVGTRRVIAQLEDQRKNEIKARTAKRPGGQPSAAMNANPVFQQLKLSLAEVEAQVASLRARVNEYQGRYDGLRNSARMVPEVEAELAQLNRDYEVNKRNYEQLVARRESASMTGEMDATSSITEFRQIDPPRVNPKPVAPNRPLLLAGALMLSIAAGIIATFLRDQLRPTFQDSRSLREETGLPLLGQVSMLVDDIQRARARRGLLAFSASTAAFVGLYAVGIAYFTFKQLTAA